VVLLHQCRKADAVRCANRIFKTLKEQMSDPKERELFTVSIGILHYQGESKTLFPEDLIEDARRALVSAKSLGSSRYSFPS
jgi:GGDEF domain-containing protein